MNYHVKFKSWFQQRWHLPSYEKRSTHHGCLSRFPKAVWHGRSELVDVQFGVPQGSILGPVIINFYANDLNDIVNCIRHSNIQIARLLSSWILLLNNGIASCAGAFESWSSNSNLLINVKKTKQILISTDQKSRVHKQKGQITLHKFLAVSEMDQTRD